MVFEVEKNKSGQHKVYGFSLIELMVVIAIVGLLAAVAVPSYSNYINKTKASSFVPIIDSLMTKTIEYSQAHGHFGNAYELGLSATSGSTIDDAILQNLNPHFFVFPSFPSAVGDTSSPTSCGATGIVTITVDPATLGIKPTDADLILINCFIWHSNEAINNFCSYMAVNTVAGDMLTDDIIPGMTNNCASTDCSVHPAAVTSFTSKFNTATCQ